MASYVSLEPSSLSSLGVTAPSFEGTTASFLATSSFIYTLFFIAIVGAAFYRYAIAGGLRMQANENSIRQSNEIIKKATLGLLGVFSLFLILFTVNKGLVTGDVGLEGFGRNGTSTTVTPPVTTNTPSDGTNKSARDNPPIPKNNDDPDGWGAIKNDSTVRAQLSAMSISVNRSVCINPVQTSCTTVGGLHPDTLSMLADLRKTCSGKITITGGSEAGHKSHGPGLTPVDLSLSDSTLEECIRGFPAGKDIGFCRKTYQKFGYTFCDEIGVRHWHVYK